ncbi:hypothetical protein ACQJBY_071160 [Aegilops geniculata]
MSSSGGRTRSTTAAAAGRSSSRARRRAALSCVSSPPTTPPCCAMASGRPPSPSASSSPGTAAAPEPSCSDPAECSTRSLCSPSRHRSCALGRQPLPCLCQGRKGSHPWRSCGCRWYNGQRRGGGAAAPGQHPAHNTSESEYTSTNIQRTEQSSHIFYRPT